MMSRQDKDLQRYFDGELGSRRARDVHDRLQGSDADRGQMQVLEQTRSALRQSVDDAADEANFDYLWTRIKVGIDEQERPGPGERILFWFRRYGMLAGSAMAVVLLAVFLLRPAPPPAVHSRNDAVVESLEVGPEAFSTIFTIDDPTDTGQTTVIWVTESSAEGIEGDMP